MSSSTSFLVGGETSSREGSLTPQAFGSKMFEDISDNGFAEDDAMGTTTQPKTMMAFPPGFKRAHTWEDGLREYQPSSLPSEYELHNLTTMRSRLVQPQTKRHYKKDSRFVLDLYTLTFDENETVDEIEMCKTLPAADPGEQFLSLAPSSISIADSPSSGPMSLGSNCASVQCLGGSAQGPRPNALPSLETNLHKILARKIQDSEDVSFRKAKLLTKAYYKLLRDSSFPIIDPQLQVQQQQQLERASSKRIGADRLSWQTLLSTDPVELKRIVMGLTNTVKALNEFLMDLLEERDDLLSKQDSMLEEISELTDNLL